MTNLALQHYYEIKTQPPKLPILAHVLSHLEAVTALTKSALIKILSTLIGIAGPVLLRVEWQFILSFQALKYALRQEYTGTTPRVY